MKTDIFGRLGRLVLALCLAGLTVTAFAADQSPADVWATVLKEHYFKNKVLHTDNPPITLKTPYRAEDAAVVPISIHAKIPQTADHYIKTLWVFIDKNPVPLAGIFHMTREMGRADLAMRIRIDQYTNVRAIAEMNNGDMYMVVNFVKAQGGCSAPAQGDLEAAMKRRGKMKFRIIDQKKHDTLDLAQLLISHPNLTGLQLDQRTRSYIPADYVKKIVVKYNGTPIMTAETGISISADPSYRFFFKPDGKGGKVTADVVDSKGQKYKHTFDIKA